MTWVVSGCSEIGTSHLARGAGCEDRNGWEILENAIVLVVADGAGSAAHAAVGAETVVASALASARRQLAPGLPPSDESWRALLSEVLEEVRGAVESRAREGVGMPSSAVVQVDKPMPGLFTTDSAPVLANIEDALDRAARAVAPVVHQFGRWLEDKLDSPPSAAHGRRDPPHAALASEPTKQPPTVAAPPNMPKDCAAVGLGVPLASLASTLCCVIVAGDVIAILHIGDNWVIVEEGDESLSVVSGPVRAEYANVTNFVTSKQYREKAQLHVRGSKGLRAIALMTDGLEELTVDLASGKPFEPFFRRIFGHARANAHDTVLVTRDIAELLRSAGIGAATSDDKTLIVAVPAGADS